MSAIELYKLNNLTWEGKHRDGKPVCYSCDGVITPPTDVMTGEIVTCPDCGNDYEVAEKTVETADVKTKALYLKEAETVGEDWGE